MSDSSRFIIAAVSFLIFSTLFDASDASAQLARRQRYTAQQRAQIRATPIMERPSRPFHFYGNTVRRNASSKPARTTRSVSQVAASNNSALVSSSTVAESVLTTTSESEVLPAAASSAATQKAEFKSTPSSIFESNQSINAKPELDGPITIHLTDLNDRQPVSK